ncbi:MAG: OmpH family outer membrane protein [Bacteroidaceae bacterium]|nr:OmpH family outer membrane protein [Bacteroidaceae bacterium]
MRKVYTMVLGGLMMVAAGAAITSCNNENNGEPTAAAAPEKAPASKGVSYKIAYVQIDTLTSQYQKCKDLEEEFAKKRANAEATINAKGKNFTAQMQEFNRKYQSNQFTQQQFEAEQARLGKLQQDLQDLQARLSNSLQEEYQKEFQALTDTIQNFTKSYAKEKGYDFILCKSSGIDNVLYANEAYEVTDEVVKALNKRYSKAAPKKEEEKKK